MDARARAHLAQRTDTGAARGYRYARHRPEHTVLYQVVELHADPFFEHLSEQGASRPGFVREQVQVDITCDALRYVQ